MTRRCVRFFRPRVSKKKEVTTIANWVEHAGSAALHTDWEEVYRSVGQRLLRQIERLVGPDAAPDLVHECFLRAMRSSRTPHEPEQLRYWLFRIATNLAVDELRRRQRWAKLVRLLPAPTPPRSAADADDVRAALQRIPPDQATALVLRLGEGVKPRELAQLLGVSESAVKSRLARGRLAFVAAYRRSEGS